MAASEARRDKRENASIRARLRARGPEQDALVLDMSSRGMLLSAAMAPQRGEIVEIVLGRTVLVGQVRWSSGRNFGVGLSERINIAAVLQGQAGPIVASRAVASDAASSGNRFDLSDYGLFALAGVTSLVFLVYAMTTWVLGSL